MASTGWESSDLLTRFNNFAGRPTTDAITDPQKYTRLADGQESVLVEIANVAPNAVIGPPTAMTTADGGKTFTFGTDGNGYPLFPIGKAQVFPALNAVPNYPWNPGLDYLDEGIQIRMPNNIAWTGTLYWRGITPPQAISASVQPIIEPPASRLLIVIKAVQGFAEEYLRNAALADEMQVKWEREWPKTATMIRRHFRGGRTLGSLSSPYIGRGMLGFGAGFRI